jgi:hypothetical protein
MRKSRFLLIKDDVWRNEILITDGTDKELYAYIWRTKKYKFTDEEKMHLTLDADGRTVQLKHGACIIRLRKEKTRIGIDIATLAHEIFHAVYFVLDRKGVRLVEGSDEAFAYYIGFIMRKCLEEWD